MRSLVVPRISYGLSVLFISLFRSATAQPCSPYRYGARNFFAVYVNRLLKGVDIVVYILGVMRYGVAILCYGVGCDALFDVRYFMKLWY